MKLIADPGALSRRSDELNSFLAETRENGVLLTDFALAEAFNGANIRGLQRTFRVLAKYPAQIEVLKVTPRICRMLPRRDDLPTCLVDELESNRIRTFCHDLFSGSAALENVVAERAKTAGLRIEPLVDASDEIRRDISKQLEQLPPDGLKILRAERRLTAEMGRELSRTVIEATIQWLQDLGTLSDQLKPRDVAHSFVLRFVLANYVLGLVWGLRGGLRSVRAKVLQNDVTDMTYVAYATLGDGLFTADKKMDEIYRHTRSVVVELFE